jgi:phosphate-selective porin OprO/OprP
MLPDQSIRGLVLAAVLVATPALAAPKPTVQEQLEALQKTLEAQQAQLAAQQRQIENQQAELAALKSQSAAASAPAVGDKLEQAQSAIARVEQKVEQSAVAAQDRPKLSFSGNRPTITSADGRSSLSIRANVQMDAAHYVQVAAGPLTTDFRRGSVGATANRETNSAQNLSDGAYFRRARLGVEGVIARDFNYRLLMELGGAGTEGPTRINDAWISYTGFAPLAVQVGAFAPGANLDDGTAPEDLVFIERATVSELSRTLGGADGRLALALKGAGSRWMGTLALTSRTVNDAEVSDSQLATVGRAGFLVATSDEYNVHVGASGTYVFTPPDQGSSVTSGRHSLRFRDRPEIRVDSTRLIDTGAIDAYHAYAAGVEFAANWRSLYLQGENFWYGIERRQPTNASNPNFGGYYVQGSWVLTGERHRYNMATGSYQSPRPFKPFASGGGIGAWELAVRYSHADLDSNAGTSGAAPAGSVRGGVQDIWTAGINWYLNPNLRVLFNYLHVNVDRLNPAGATNLTPFGASPLTPPLGAQIGQHLNVYAIRTQFSF